METGRNPVLDAPGFHRKIHRVILDPPEPRLPAVTATSLPEYFRRVALRTVGAALCVLCATHSPAVEISGKGWTVLYNLPDGDFATGFGDDEFRLHRHLAGRIASLGAGDSAVLGTFTWSANEAGAGRLLYEMDKALKRGATVAFIGSSSVSTSNTFGNNQDFTARSINTLLAAHPTAFTYVASAAGSGSHHNKIGLFDYSASGVHGGGRFVFTSSMNFTGASSTQWNIAVEVEGPELHAIYLQETAEHLAGRFGDNPAKSHAHDGSTFTLDGRPGQRVRFSPPPGSTAGGDNPETEIIQRIHAAEFRIVFSLNKLTLAGIADALIAAANRGVTVIGSMPASDTAAGGDSHTQYQRLADPASYQTANTVVFLPAYHGVDSPAADDGSVPNLIHAKSMVIDDRYVIHGSPNWTFTALRSASGNDENLLFLDHPGIANAFLRHFESMTRTTLVEIDLAAWDFSGLSGYGPSPFAPRVSHPLLAVSGWTRGPSVGTSGTAAANAWGGNGWSESNNFAAAAADGSTAGFALTAPQDHTLTLTAISAHNFRRSSTGPASVQWQFQLGNQPFANLGEPIQLTSTGNSGNPQDAIDLSGIPGMTGVSPATTVAFRVVNANASGNAGTWYLRNFNAEGDDFILRGFISPANPPPAGTYTSWAATHLGGQPPDADFDLDGIPNLIEYALLTNPNGPDPGLHGGMAGTANFTKRPQAVANGDVSYTLMVSTDLDDWQPAPPDYEDDDIISITLPVDPDAGRQFIRLRVTLGHSP